MTGHPGTGVSHAVAAGRISQSTSRALRSPSTRPAPVRPSPGTKHGHNGRWGRASWLVEIRSQEHAGTISVAACSLARCEDHDFRRRRRLAAATARLHPTAPRSRAVSRMPSELPEILENFTGVTVERQVVLFFTRAFGALMCAKSRRPSRMRPTPRASRALPPTSRRQARLFSWRHVQLRQVQGASASASSGGVAKETEL
jgi:hypothetical protein